MIQKPTLRRLAKQPARARRPQAPKLECSMMYRPCGLLVEKEPRKSIRLNRKWYWKMPKKISVIVSVIVNGKVSNGEEEGNQRLYNRKKMEQCNGC